MLERFVERYGQVYGEGALLLGGGNEVELHRVVGTRPIEPGRFPEHESAGPDAVGRAARASATAYFEPAGFTPTRVYDGDALRAGQRDRRSGDHRADGRQRRRAARLPRAASTAFLTIRLGPVRRRAPGARLAGRAEVA